MSGCHNRAWVKFILQPPLHLFCLFRLLIVHFMIYPPTSDRYPYEAIKVITADGYVLLLERIPR
jgi:hypothetical protein